jgi:lipopolysaccharide transport system ATP-binding protein
MMPNGQAGEGPSGARIEVDPAGARINVDPPGARINVDPPGARINVDPAGARIEVDPAGARINVDPAGARIEANSPGARIEVEGLTVFFPLYHGNSRSLKKTVFAAATGRLGRDAQQRPGVQALRDVSFQLNKGDRLGLVGANGAGKTTLLRALAGVYEPVIGRVRLQGSINALLNVQLGMNLDLTGRENITLRGLYDGLSRAALARLADDVASFADLGDFIDLPVRIYSSGMMVRLAFALATAIRPQILLMDEWILAGDAGFLDRARVRLEDMVRGAEILVLSTHMPSVIRTWCSRVIWLDQGRVHEDGPAEMVLDNYIRAVSPEGHVAAPDDTVLGAAVKGVQDAGAERSGGAEISGPGLHRAGAGAEHG